MIKKCLQDPQEGKKWMLTCCNYYKITLQKKDYHAWWKFSSERNEAVWNEKHFRDTYKILNHFLEHFINHKPLVSGEWSHCYNHEPSFEHEVKAKVFFVQKKILTVFIKKKSQLMLSIMIILFGQFQLFKCKF